MAKFLTFIQSKYFPIVFFFTLGLFTLVWFKDFKIIDTLDLAFPYNPTYYFERIFTVWNNSNNYGVLDTRFIPNLLPLGLYFKIVSLIHLPLWTMQWLLVYFCFSFSGYAMYKLCTELKTEKLAAIIAGVFYVVNPFSLAFIWSMRSTFFVFYAFLPYALCLYIALLKNKKLKLTNVLIFILLNIFLLSASFSNPAMFGIYVLLLSGYTLYNYILTKQSNVLYIYFISISLIILLSLYWLLPQALTINETAQNASTIVNGTRIDDLKILDRSSKSVEDAFKLTGFWALNGTYRGLSYFPWYASWNSPIVQSILFLPALIFGYFVLKSRNEHKLALTLIVLTSIFFLAGTNTLYPEIKVKLFTELPFVSTIFRNLETKFGPILLLGLAPIFGIGCTILLKKKYLKFIVAIPLTIYCCVMWLPIVKGSVVSTQDNVYPASKVNVPAYYNEAQKYLSTLGDVKGLSLPLNTAYQTAYMWREGFVGTDPSRYILQPGILTNSEGLSFIIPKTAANLLTDGNNITNALNFMGQQNIGYTVIHKDTYWNFVNNNKLWTYSNESDIDSLIKNTEKYSQTIGQLTIVRTPTTLLNNKLFTSNKLIYGYGSTENLYTAILNNINYDKEALLITNPSRAINTNNTRNLGIIWGSDSKLNGKIELENPAPLYFKDSQQLVSVSSRTNGELVEVRLRRRIPQVKIEEVVIPEKTIEEQIITFNVSKNKQPYLKIDNSIVKLKTESEYNFVTDFSLTSTKSISAYYESGTNLINNGDFNSGPWQGEVTDCSAGLPGVANISQRIVKYDTLNAIELTAINHTACVSSTINTLNKADLYSLSFMHKSEGASPAKYCVWEEALKNCTELKKLESKTEWEKYNSIFVPSQNSKLSLYLYAEAQYNTPTINTYADVQVQSYEKISDYTISLRPNQAIIPIGETKKLANGEIEGVIEGIDNGNFSSGAWQDKVSNCSRSLPGEPGIAMEVINQSLMLTSKNHIACTSTNIDNYAPGYSYKITMRYKNIEGSTPTICIWEVNANKCIVDTPIDSKTTTDEWSIFTQTFESSNASTSAKLYLYVNGATGDSTNIFDDITVQKLPISSSSLIYAFSDPTKNTNTDTNIDFTTFKMLRPTKYEVSINKLSNNSALAFLESYNKGWQAKIKGQKYSLPIHVQVNGFANGWYVDVNDLCVQRKLCTQAADGSWDIDLIVEFTPQRWFYIGSIISGTTFVAVVGYLVYDTIHRRKNRKLAIHNKKPVQQQN